MQFRALISTGTTPSSSAIFGTAGSASLLRSITEATGSVGFFGSVHDQHAHLYNAFVTNIVQPIQATITRMTGAMQATTNPDVYRPLTTTDDLIYVPPIMHVPLLMHPPMLKMLQQGRIEGWGYVPENLAGNEDVFGRLISNGVIEDCLEALESGEEFVSQIVHDSDDPDVTLEDIDAVATARSLCTYILENTNYDPTAYPLERS